MWNFCNRQIGIHPPENKATEGLSLQKIQGPSSVHIPMDMVLGPPSRVLVKKDDPVLIGQLIGEAQGFLGVPVHATVSGKVKRVYQDLRSNGKYVDVIEVENDGLYQVDPELKAPTLETFDDFIAAVKNSGLVGLGGAGFPAHVKLNPPKDKNIVTLIVNAAECEPYLTSDDYLCRHEAKAIIRGIELVLKWCKIPEAVIALEDNMPAAYESLKVALKDSADSARIRIQKLPTIYPQGAEKMLIRTVTKKEVPSGALPFDVGVLVMNVNSVAFLAQYMENGMPLVRRTVTLDGSSVKNPGLFSVPFGCMISDLVEFAGGLKAEAAKILMGGPMMGVAVDSIDSPIIKTNNGILVFAEADATLPAEQACIHCGRCVRSCPMNLIPSALDLAARKQSQDALEKFVVMDCIECGACTYVCPAKRFLVQNIRAGKRFLQDQIAAKRKAEAAKAGKEN